VAEIHMFPGSGYSSNSYLIIDELVVLIDSGAGSKRLAREVEDRAGKVDLIINTHAHFDHVAGNRFFSAEIAVHEMDRAELESGSLYGTAELFQGEARSRVSRALRDGELIGTGELELEVIHTPGHTPGSICILASTGHLFSGDTLFAGGGVGRVDLPGGSALDMRRSLERLKKVEFKFLMPGHMESAGDGREHLEAALEMMVRFL